MSENNLAYSIQQTYILTHVLTPEREIVTCNQRIDIPTIEPLTQMKSFVYQEQPGTVVPCIELAGEFLSEFDLTLETNEGVTVLPVKIQPGSDRSYDNPYTHFRYVLVLPRGATGVKSCKLIHKATGKEVQHNFTFGIMPPPYNYDNALFGVITSEVLEIEQEVENLKDRVDGLNLVTNSPYFPLKQLPKGAGRQTINIENGMLYFHTILNFLNISGDKTMNLIITLNDKSYTLALSKGSEAVLVDLVAGGIFVYLPSTGEVLKELRFNPMTSAYKTISYEGFDDILLDKLQVTISGRKIA